MDIQKMTFKTNISTAVAADEVKSAFKSDRRIWSLDWEENAPGYLVHVAAEMYSSEVESKIRSIGYEASLIKNA